MVVSAVLLATGCHRDATSQPDWAQVSGTVRMAGQPLQSGTITFVPIVSEEEGGRPGLARIERDGSYQVGNASPAKRPGLGPGRYKVTVLVMSLAPGPGGQSVPRLTVPERYTQSSTTPFEVEVDEATHRFDFDLDR